MPTAYEEALATSDASPTTGQSGIPSYMVAADSHNVASGDRTFLESAAETVESVGRFVGLSLISGANSIYNIPADVGNVLGGDFERSEMDDIVSEMDSDMGRYYQDHKEGIETVGFVASSMIPGLAGVKVLKAGQAALRTKRFGENTAKAHGFLIPGRQLYLDLAIKEAISGKSVNALTSTNALRAMAAGAGQNVLEAAAFEIAVASTLFNSPVLEGQDRWDLAANIAFGGVVFGAVGGAISAVGSSFAIRKAVTAANKEAFPWEGVTEVATASATYEKLASRIQQLHNIPEVPKSDHAMWFGKSAEYIEGRTEFLKTASAKKAQNLQGLIKEDIKTLANGDQATANAWYELTKASEEVAKLGNVIGADQIARVADKTAIEARIATLQKGTAKGVAGAEEELMNLGVTYQRVWGEEVGVAFTSKPKLTSISDTLKKGQSIDVTPGKVSAGNKSWEFSTSARRDPFSTLKADVLKNQARHIWAQKLAPFEHSPKKPMVVSENDIPLLEKAYREFHPDIKVALEEGGDVVTFHTQENLFNFLVTKKVQLSNRMHEASRKSGKLLSTDEIAAAINVRPAYIEGIQSIDGNAVAAQRDIFALQSYGEEYTTQLVKQGSRDANKGQIDIWDVPQHLKVTYDASGLESTGRLSNHVVENMAILQAQQKLYSQGTDRAVASALGEKYGMFPEWTQGMTSEVNSLGAGSRFLTAASSNYGSPAAYAEWIGNATTGAIEHAKKVAKEALEPALYNLGQNKAAAIEYALLEQRLRSIPDTYMLNEAGDAYVHAATAKWQKEAAKASASGTKIPKQPTRKAADSPLEIPIKHAEARAVAKLHIETNGARLDKYRPIRTAQGIPYTKQADEAYPIPVDINEYPHFAIVVDTSITGTGRSKTLYAATEQELEAMGTKLASNPHLRVMYKAEAEKFHKLEGQFEYEKTLHDNFLDIEMHRKGTSAPFLVPTDPQKIVGDILSWHMKQETSLVREAVLAKYEVPFAEIRALGEGYTAAATSRFGSLSLKKGVESKVANPYEDYITTSLGLKKYEDYPNWVRPNRAIDEAFSKMFSKVDEVWTKSKTPEELTEVNSVLRSSGYKGATYDEAMDVFVNHSAPKGALTKFVQQANAILATVVLRWDTLNAVNNAVSANVLLGAETKAVIRAITRGDAGAVGALADLQKSAYITTPGTTQKVLSPTKLIANAVRKFGTDTPEMQWFKDNRFVTSISDQYTSTLDNLAVSGRETIRELEGKVATTHSKLREVADTGEKWTGNKLAEEFNRFVAADVMKQLTDIAVSSKLMTPKQALSYINTFVNRTQGNYLAAQRPMLFQGPVGQAIGLFQTYQFNLIQQLLRHVGEGHAKDGMTLLALQGTIHGMNGLPGFNAANTALLGNASGNQAHKDMFDVTYGIAGKEAGDWFMYGAASNALGLLDPDLKVNLYTRGDINPRHVTLVPTSPADVPAYQAASKFFSNLYETGKKLSTGGDVGTTLLQGLEHNGISRPLAGLAQTLQAFASGSGMSYSTSKKGNVIAANDLMELANVGRMLGGKPFDEAIAIDAAYRFKAYGIRDANKRRLLGESIKSTMIAGNVPDNEQVEDFAAQYTEYGGKQDEFTSWFRRLYKTANVSQANKIKQDLDGPFSQSMQRIMGGLELRDFSR